MSVQAIVYTSQTGSTAAYAVMLAERAGLPCYSLKDASKAFPKGTSILYMGWLMAGSIKDYKKAAKLFRIAAVCTVGLDDTPDQAKKSRQTHQIAKEVPLFPLRGGYFPDKLPGIYRFMMKLVTKVLVKEIQKKNEHTADDLAMMKVLVEGGSFVEESCLQEVLAFLTAEQEDV